MRTWAEIRRDRALIDITGGMTAKFERYAEEIKQEFAKVNSNLSLIRDLLERIVDNTTAPETPQIKLINKEVER